MIKHGVLFFVILLVGCHTFPTGEIKHSWLFVDDGRYNVKDNSFNITVVYDKQQRYYRVGAHDSWGTKQLDSRLLNVSIQLDEDFNKINVYSEFQQDSENLSNVPKPSSSKELCANPAGLALNQLPENQETYQYHMTVCSDSLIITDTMADSRCVIDLADLNEELIQLDVGKINPLATYFNYSLQDKDGSVLLWEHNYGDFSGKDTINIYHPSCSPRTSDSTPHKKSVSIEKLGPRLLLDISHYGTPAIMASNSKSKQYKIMTLSGGVLKYSLDRTSRGGKTLFLPDEKYLYDFDIDYQGSGEKMHYEVIVTRYDFGNDRTEKRRITVNQPRM